MFFLFLDFSFFDFVDIVLVATLFYFLYKFLRNTAAGHTLIGLASIYLIWKLVEALKMELFSEILGQFISVGVLAVIIVFQQEIRRFLIFIGKQNWTVNFLNRWFSFVTDKNDSGALSSYSLASFFQSAMRSKTGVLIVFKRKDTLDYILNTGVRLNADVGEVLLKMIFFKNAPLHDGAVVIEDTKVLSAGVILPVSKKNIAASYGLRHRAALGIVEQTDAFCVVVSEETGRITFAHDQSLRTKKDDLSVIEIEEELKRIF